MEPISTKSSAATVALVTLVALIAVGAWLRITNFSNVSFRSPDERTYARQANLFLQEGTAGFRALVRDYRSDPGLRTEPPPTRPGYLWLVASAMRVTGRRDETAVAYLSLAASIGSLLIAAIIGVRFLPAWAAVFAVLFFSVFPPELAIARRGWIDAPMEFFALILIWASAEIARDSRRRAWSVVFVVTFGFVGAFLIAIKDSGLAFFGLCTLWVLWATLIRRRDRQAGLTIAAAAFAGAVLGIGWIAYSAGSVPALVDTVSKWLAANSQNDYALEYQTGAPYLLPYSVALLSPAVAVLCLVGLFMAAFPRDTVDSQTIRPVTVAMLGFLALPMVIPHWMNLRYVSPLFGPACLLAGTALWYCVSIASRRGVWALEKLAPAAAVVAVFLCVGDYLRFEKIFVRGALPDLSLKMVLEASPLSDEIAVAETRAVNEPTAENYLNLSVVYDRNKKYRESIEAATHALQIRPDFAEAYNNIGAGYNNLGLWDEAIKAEQSALRIAPNYQLARNNLEWSLSQKAKKEKLELAPTRVPIAQTPENYLNISLQQYQNHDYAACIQAAREALKLKPDYAEAYNNIAAAYQAMGMWDEAIQAALQALKIKPDFQLARNNLQYSLEQKRRAGGK
jgi:tetratricopeptide (TPR) repeat protein